MKLYGCLDNRFEENRYFNGTKGNLKVGTPCTVYLWSDCNPYEIVKVENQEHIFIREMKATRIDNYGMSDYQSYKYESDESKPIEELQLTKYGWKKVQRYTKELYDKIMKKVGYCIWGQSILEKVREGKEVKRYKKINISFGKAEKYFDYSF